jgi:serine protease Do
MHTIVFGYCTQNTICQAFLAPVVVTGVEPGSAAAEAMLQMGDVIREVNRKPVANVSDFDQKIEKAKGQESLLLLIQRGQNSLFTAVTPR